jgi:hypothetical protein
LAGKQGNSPDYRESGKQMNKQTFISKRAFSQQEATPGASNSDGISPMTFDTATNRTPRTLSKFKKLQNPILVKRVNFETPLFRQ